MTALDLARWQFGFTIAFHIVFPSLSIGLAAWLALIEAMWVKTADESWLRLSRWWTGIFAMIFGMGVVSGVVLSYQFGTNWGGFSTFAGPVTGPLLSWEVLTAFFLEAGFLGVMLFGRNRVSPRVQLAATVMVSIGTLISATWILSANSWIQTPRGIDVVDGHVVPLDWWAILFNPSFPYRLVHMVLGAFLASALFVAAAGAWRIFVGRDGEAERRSLSMGLWALIVLAPLQIFAGDSHGLNTLRHQPAKIAAIEGHWRNEPGEGVPLVLFALPDMATETNRWAVEIPRLGSLILTHSFSGSVPALTDFPRDDRPNATIVFWAFRVMVGLGLAMLGLGLSGLVLRRNGALFRNRTFLAATIAMGPAGIVAVLAGWMTTEIGRQPWAVWGLLRTADAVTPHPVVDVAIGLAFFVVVYFVVFGAGILQVLRLIAHGPRAAVLAAAENTADDARPARPMSAAPDHESAPTSRHDTKDTEGAP